MFVFTLFVFMSGLPVMRELCCYTRPTCVWKSGTGKIHTPALTRIVMFEHLFPYWELAGSDK